MKIYISKPLTNINSLLMIENENFLFHSSEDTRG